MSARINNCRRSTSDGTFIWARRHVGAGGQPLSHKVSKKEKKKEMWNFHATELSTLGFFITFNEEVRAL